MLVTGATGFVGSHVVRKLLKAGHQVRILRRGQSRTKLIDGLEVETAIGDVTDRESVLAAVQGCDVVFHVAGFVSFWRGNNEIQRRINVDGTRNVVEACLTHKIKRLVHTSSIAAIGFAPEGRLGNEALEYNWWPYRINYCDTKHLAEEEVRQGIAERLAHAAGEDLR
jgi:dihydroflavonol-4-reductase